MLNFKKFTFCSIAWLLMPLVLLLAGCQPIQPIEPATDDTEAWVPRHVILIGPNKPNAEKLLAQNQEQGEPVLGALDQAAARLGLTEIITDGIAPIELGQLIAQEFGPDVVQNEKVPPLEELVKQTLQRSLSESQLKRVREGDLVAKLFDFAASKYWNEVDPTNSLTVLLKEIEARQEEFDNIEEGSFVVAQPNYWLAANDAQESKCLNVIGTPDGGSVITGGAMGNPDIVTAPDPETIFANQLAFERLTQSGTLKLNDLPTGNLVRVVIFDTSPFTTISQAENFQIPGTGVDLLRDAAFKQTGTAPTSGPSEIKQHGLFVARLVRAVAPQSDIELVRILDTDACGQIYILHQELARVLQETVGDPAPLVLNLSLGYHTNGQADPIIPLLSTLMQQHPNTLMVAAAGNDGMGTPSLYPAFYSTQYSILAVTGIDRSGVRSCFSNEGTVGAFAGQGILPGCTNSTDPADKIISIMSSTDYAYWTGTSFSTPLVSGLAARCLSSGLSATQTIANLDSGPGIDEVTLAMCPPPQ